MINTPSLGDKDMQSLEIEQNNKLFVQKPKLDDILKWENTKIDKFAGKTVLNFNQTMIDNT